MKTYGGMELSRHTFLTSALDGGEWSVSRSGRFTPSERTVGTHWIGGKLLQNLEDAYSPLTVTP